MIKLDNFNETEQNLICLFYVSGNCPPTPPLSPHFALSKN